MKLPDVVELPDVKMKGKDWYLWYGGKDFAGEFWYLAFPNPEKPNKIRKTSVIVRTDGNYVYTESKACYEIEGPPTENWLLELESRGLTWDPDNPVPERFWWKGGVEN